jgi:sugar lactone lactonase YvrE
MLVVSMRDRRLLQITPEGLGEVADLSALASPFCNDMVVDWHGRAYIGSIGFDPQAPPNPPKLAEIVLVMPDGAAAVVADKLAFPNGTVITPDGETLIVAESLAGRLSAFTIEEDGSLTQRRVWAQFDDMGPGPLRAERVTPDGICLDAEGAVWVASFGTDEVLRVREGGVVTERIRVRTTPYACMLGGLDRHTLFVLTADRARPGRARAKDQGRIETVQVDVPGAGLP